MTPPLDPFPDQADAIRQLREQTSRQLISDLGWGKTLVGIELDRDISNAAPTLVICPDSAKWQWADTFARQGWSSHYVTVYERKKRNEFLAFLYLWSDVFIVPWSCLRKLPRTAQPIGNSWVRDVLTPALESVRWAHVICDEAHRLGNRHTQQRRAVKALKTSDKTAITSTPMPTYPQQWWGILNWLYPKEFRSYWRFFERYVAYDEIDVGHRRIKKITGTRNEAELMTLVRPYTYKGTRRLGTRKHHTKIYVELSDKQRRAYDEMEERFYTWIDQQTEDDLNAAANGANPWLAKNAAVQRTRLQQLALSYANFDAGVFHAYEPSAKLDAFMDLLADSHDARFLVYSQFRGSLLLLRERLAKAGVSYGMYIGGFKDRETDKRAFADGRLRVMLATVGAGGEAIDGWQRHCSTVVFLDRPDSPTDNLQAEGRLHRTGQRFDVNIIDLIARGTIEDDKRRATNAKWQWITNFLKEHRNASSG